MYQRQGNELLGLKSGSFHAGDAPRMLRCRYAHPGPGTDVPGRDEVGMRLVVTHAALEFGLALAVGLLAVSALGARSAGVPGIYRDHRDASQPGLVLDEGAELEEGPSREPVASVSAPSRCPFAYAFEVFKANTAAGALGGLYDLLGNAVIFVLAEPGLLGSGSLHGPADVLGPLALSSLGASGLTQCRTPFAVVLACGVDLLTRELLAIFGRGDVDDAEVHAHEAGRRDRRGLGQVDRNQQEPLAVVAEDEVGLTLGVGKPFGLVLPEYERDEQPTVERPEIHTIQADESHDSRVVSDCGVLAKLRPLVAIPFVHFANAMDDQDRCLGRKAESIA